MTAHKHYFEHEPSDLLACPTCAWTGAASKSCREWFDELMDFRCPRCKTMLLIVAYPTLSDMRNYATAGNAKAIRELAEFERIAGES